MCKKVRKKAVVQRACSNVQFSASVFHPDYSFLCLLFQTLLEVGSLIPKTKIATLVVSIVAIVGLMLTKELNAFLSKKIPIPIPVELLGVSIIHTVYDFP